MNKPTHGQWKGYAVMSMVLMAALIVLIVNPFHRRAPQTSDHSEMEAAIERFGDSMLEANERQRKEWYATRSHRTDSYQSTTGDKSWYRDSNQNRKKAPRQIVQLNSADTLQLQELYGIGPTFARRIVKYRNLLGGYVRKEQLLEVYGMDAERYNQIASYISVDPSAVKKIDINSASINDLKRHPYLDYYQAKALVAYRERGNTFSSMDDLLKVNLIEPSTTTKLQGYIQFNP